MNIGLRYDFVPIPLPTNGTGPEYYNIPTNNTMQVCGLGGVPDSCNIFDQH